MQLSRTKFNRLEFKKLQDAWYSKLKQSGFDDAENGPYLKEWDSFYFQSRHEPLSFHHKHDYYYLAFQFLNSYSFPSPIDKQIWGLHSDGVSFRTISTLLKKENKSHTDHCQESRCDIFCENHTSSRFIVNKDKIALIVAKYKKIMLGKLKEENE